MCVCINDYFYSKSLFCSSIFWLIQSRYEWTRVKTSGNDFAQGTPHETTPASVLSFKFTNGPPESPIADDKISHYMKKKSKLFVKFKRLFTVTGATLFLVNRTQASCVITNEVLKHWNIVIIFHTIIMADG